DGFTPLLLALREQKPHIAKYLIRHGANLHACDEYKRTTLMYAVKWDREDIVELLLQRGVDYQSRDTFGWNALYYATVGKRKAKMMIIEHDLLLLRRQNPFTRNQSENVSSLRHHYQSDSLIAKCSRMEDRASLETQDHAHGSKQASSAYSLYGVVIIKERLPSGRQKKETGAIFKARHSLSSLQFPLFVLTTAQIPLFPVRFIRLAPLLTTVLDSYHSRRRSPYATCLPVRATSCAAPRPRPAGTRHDTRILLWQLTRSFIGYSFFMHSGSSRFFSRFSSSPASPLPEPVQQLLSYGFSTQLTPRGLLP
ncbi:hypothetical protein STEG23_034727, partial [Scotinomys teguina]